MKDEDLFIDVRNIIYQMSALLATLPATCRVSADKIFSELKIILAANEFAYQEWKDANQSKVVSEWGGTMRCFNSQDEIINAADDLNRREREKIK